MKGKVKEKQETRSLVSQPTLFQSRSINLYLCNANSQQKSSHDAH